MTMDEPRDGCWNCLFWGGRHLWHNESMVDAMDSCEWVGRCHRYPPVFDPVCGSLIAEQDGEDEAAESSLVWQQPRTESETWCGEWRLRPGPVPRRLPDVPANDLG